ncbi:hypothetical protein HKD37_10G028239 [Glycine soja]
MEVKRSGAKYQRSSSTNSFFLGLFPSGWCLPSPLLLCLPLHLHDEKSPLKDLIEAQRSNLHRSSTSKLPSSGIRAQELQFLLPFVFKPPTRKNHNLGTNMSHHSSSVNGNGTSHKDPLSRILDELSSFKLWKEKQERKEKGKKRVEEISQDERKKIREEERRKIMKEMKREKHVSYSSHNSCKSLSEELRDYYEGRHRSHLRPHSHRREKERKPQEANINLPYFHGNDNVEANLVWEIRVEQQLKKKSTPKSYGSHSYPKKDQGQGILGVTPSKPKDDKGKTIEKQAPKASMQEKTSFINSQDEATTSPSSSESEEAKGEESSKEIYPQEEGQPLMVKEECKEVSVSSKRLVKKESHFEIKTNIKETSPLRQPPHLLLCKKTLVSTATPLGLEVIPQVNELLDEGLVRKSLNPCALLVPKISIIRHQIPTISDMMNLLSVATLFCKIIHAPNVFMIHVHRDSLGRFVLIFGFNTNLGAHMGHLRFVVFFCRNNQHKNTEKGVEGRSLEYEEPRDLRSNPFQGGGDDAILPPKASSSSFLSKAILGGEAPSSLAYSLVDGVSPVLFSFAFRCISMDLIEAQRSSLHRSSTSKLPSVISTKEFVSESESELDFGLRLGDATPILLREAILLIRTNS